LRRKLSGAVVAAVFLGLCACKQERVAAEKTEWPEKDWATSTPEKVGLDEGALKALDADLQNGKYQLVDSVAVFRCGKEVFAQRYAHDYAQIYEK